MTPVRTNTEALMALQLVASRVILAQLIAGPALEAMRTGTGGYPGAASGGDTSGGGQRTITIDGDAIAVSAVEAAVLSERTDTAADDLTSVYGALSALCEAAVSLSDTFARWAPNRRTLTPADIKAVSRDLWCPNPAHGHAIAPRANGSTWCSFCGSDHGQTRAVRALLTQGWDLPAAAAEIANPSPPMPQVVSLEARQIRSHVAALALADGVTAAGAWITDQDLPPELRDAAETELARHTRSAS